MLIQTCVDYIRIVHCKTSDDFRIIEEGPVKKERNPFLRTEGMYLKGREVFVLPSPRFDRNGSKLSFVSVSLLFERDKIDVTVLFVYLCGFPHSETCKSNSQHEPIRQMKQSYHRH